MPVRSHERDVAYSLLRIADSLTTAWSPCSKAGIDNDSRYWRLEHDPEKWVPIFGKRSCSNMKLEQDDDSTTNHPALVHEGRNDGAEHVRDVSHAVAVVEKQQAAEAAVGIPHQARQALDLPGDVRGDE